MNKGRLRTNRGEPRADFYRRSAGYSKLPNVLIVCEDKKAAPSYFDWLAETLGIKASVKTRQARKYYQPDNLVQYAKVQKQKGIYKKVFCVFDKDDYDLKFQKAVNMFKGKDMNDIIDAHSVPCFEFWLLLHFTYTTALMNQHEALDRLRRFLPTYNKGSKGGKLLGLSADELNNEKTGLFARLTTARENATKSLNTRKDAENSSYTKVQVVVEELFRIHNALAGR